ncbi:hypothetical protein BD324DRAFT_651315 [Kockovaella imperatae]|uniref:Uncharacterized protein n=1 Tax=Kockovaella imperatae TaxID=4999 RepID=A0A1Y1UH73_9TREE|nr:hypothetical protein BD324DRAFT_651315 [Kockovaella imperatae]ORX36834.1 hypothetical protein BD324DRAFT_651315 [Kockovaella imperatae]
MTLTLHDLPPPVIFTHNETLHSIALPPLAEFLAGIDTNDRILKLHDILDRFRTPKSYHRIDVRVVESSELPPKSPAKAACNSLPIEDVAASEAQHDGKKDELAIQGLGTDLVQTNGAHYPTLAKELDGLAAAETEEERTQEGYPIILPEGVSKEDYLLARLEDLGAETLETQVEGSAGGPADAHRVEDATPALNCAGDSAPVADDLRRPADGMVEPSAPVATLIQPPSPPASHPLPPIGPSRRIRELRLDLRTLDAAALFALETWRRELLGLDKLDMEHPDSVWYEAPPSPTPPLPASPTPLSLLPKRKRGRPPRIRPSETQQEDTVDELTMPDISMVDNLEILDAPPADIPTEQNERAGKVLSDLDDMVSRQGVAFTDVHMKVDESRAAIRGNSKGAPQSTGPSADAAEPNNAEGSSSAPFAVSPSPVPIIPESPDGRATPLPVEYEGESEIDELDQILPDGGDDANDSNYRLSLSPDSHSEALTDALVEGSPALGTLAGILDMSVPVAGSPPKRQQKRPVKEAARDSSNFNFPSASMEDFTRKHNSFTAIQDGSETSTRSRSGSPVKRIRLSQSFTIRQVTQLKPISPAHEEIKRPEHQRLRMEAVVIPVRTRRLRQQLLQADEQLKMVKSSSKFASLALNPPKGFQWGDGAVGARLASMEQVHQLSDEEDEDVVALDRVIRSEPQPSKRTKSPLKIVDLSLSLSSPKKSSWHDNVDQQDSSMARDVRLKPSTTRPHADEWGEGSPEQAAETIVPETSEAVKTAAAKRPSRTGSEASIQIVEPAAVRMSDVPTVPVTSVQMTPSAFVSHAHDEMDEVGEGDDEWSFLR